MKTFLKTLFSAKLKKFQRSTFCRFEKYKSQDCNRVIALKFCTQLQFIMIMRI